MPWYSIALIIIGVIAIAVAIYSIIMIKRDERDGEIVAKKRKRIPLFAAIGGFLLVIIGVITGTRKKGKEHEQEL